MGAKYEERFRQWVAEQRRLRGWSQAELAERMAERGLAVYPTTIAKIESTDKPRSIRLDEAAVMADLFGAPLGGPLTGGDRDDLRSAMRMLSDAAFRAHPKLVEISRTLTTAYANLAVRMNFVDLDLGVAKGHTFDWNDVLDLTIDQRRAVLMWAVRGLVGRDLQQTSATMQQLAWIEEAGPEQLRGWEHLVTEGLKLLSEQISGNDEQPS